MRCYDCSTKESYTDAIGICHHCSAGLCAAHGTFVSDPIEVHEPVAKVAALPMKARILLCPTCWNALRQTQATAFGRSADMRFACR